MGMCHNSYGVTAEEVERLLSGEMSAFDLMTGTAGDVVNGEGKTVPRPSGELYKLWQVVGAAVTGDPELEDGVLVSAFFGETVPPDDTGYGPPTLVRPEEVAELAAELDKLVVEDVVAGAKLDDFVA